MKRQLTKMEKFGLIAIIIATTMYFYIHKIYDPASEKYKTANEKLITIKQEVEGVEVKTGLDELQNGVELLRQEDEAIKFDLELLKQEKTQTNDEITNVIVEINKMMMKNNLFLNNMRWIKDDESVIEEQSIEQVMAQADQQQDQSVTQTDEQPVEIFQRDADVEWTACELEFTGKLVPIIIFFNDLYGFESLVQVSEVSLEYDEEKDKYRATMKILI